IFATTLTCIAIYLVVVLAIFEHRQRTQSAKSGGTLCLVAAIFGLIRCLFEQVELRFGTRSDTACRIYQCQLVIVFHSSFLCMYLLLWTRQLKMYNHKALRHLSSPFLRFISGAVIAGLIGSSVATATQYLITFRLISSPVGCVYDVRAIVDPESSRLVGLLLFAIAFIFQFSLLGLLVYPLLKHYKIGCCCCGEAERSSTENVRRTIIRLSVCTTMCVLSDFVSSLLLMYLHDGVSPIMFWANVYTVNLLINMICVTCSFADWKQRLFP
uniref:G-protein coupled receptors family 1 profile domain-containing protein n=1 Tax=Ciona intestinalis TaxID=7719 RepID=H2XKA6_CIOIN